MSNEAGEQAAPTLQEKPKGRENDKDNAVMTNNSVL